MRVLLVEDDAMIGQAMQRGLQQAGYAVDWVGDNAAAGAAVGGEPYAMVLLDLGLPSGDGLQLLADVRKRKKDVPVIIVTARDRKADRIRGLDLGADDYIVKPFDLDELLARMRAVLRRRAGRSISVIEHGAIRLDPVTHEVWVRDKPINLTAREFALIAMMMEWPKTVFSRRALEDRLYGWDDSVGSNAVEVHIHHLRKKLGQQVIENMRGQGYRLGEVS